MQQELLEARGVNISQWTVRRRLQESNLTPKDPSTGPKLTPGTPEFCTGSSEFNIGAVGGPFCSPTRPEYSAALKSGLGTAAVLWTHERNLLSSPGLAVVTREEV
ncbi:hypothetical protein ILUMI_23015 [Ignelater luminosus]|uniref:Transposase Tc1-like domain-containing protein n=1 Tax=Ignelater luminosus TaxID=2038154 RepID=A0A8K0CFF7_IGNLU|nr:hypothetical protein ILUMI_23015 [Ignelater luminosus]